MKKVLYVILGLVAVVAFLLLLPTDATATPEHCPEKDHPNKVEVPKGFGPSVTIPNGHEFCVKADTQASGLLTSTGEVYTVTWTNRGGQTPDISYYIDYDAGVEPSPEPSPSPTVTESPSPEPTPTPSPEPTPEPTPTDSSRPTVTPEPQEPGDGGELPSEPDKVVEELPNAGASQIFRLGLLTVMLLGIGSAMLRRQEN